MLLHTASIAVEEHVIHLFLVVYFQSFFLRGKSRLEVLQLLPQPSSLFFSLLLVSLHGFLFFSQPTSFNSNYLSLFLCLPQQTDSFFSKLPGSGDFTNCHPQVGEKILIPVHIMGNVCPHGFDCFQPVEKLSALPHEISNSCYHLRR